MDARIDILLKEYENLRREELVHKQSLRQIHRLVVTAIGALIAAFQVAGNVPVVASGLVLPVVLVSFAYGLNDIYVIFVIARHVAVIEERINELAGSDALLSWETRTSHHFFGTALVRLEGPSAARLLQPSLIGVLLIIVFGVPALVFAGIRMTTALHNPWLQALFLLIVGVSVGLLGIATVQIFRALRNGGSAEKAIRAQYTATHAPDGKDRPPGLWRPPVRPC